MQKSADAFGMIVFYAFRNGWTTIHFWQAPLFDQLNLSELSVTQLHS